jgi:hypothetical protein
MIARVALTLSASSWLFCLGPSQAKYKRDGRWARMASKTFSVVWGRRQAKSRTGGFIIQPFWKESYRAPLRPNKRCL